MKHSEMKLQEEKIQRGEILMNFAFIEHLIHDFITLHYFGTINLDFQREFLEDESFSFFLLKRVFYKILKKVNLFDTFPKKELDKLNEYRNIIAHSLLKGTARKTSSGFELEKSYLQHGGKQYEIEKLVKDYNESKKIVQTALDGLLGGGGKIINMLN